MRRTALGVVLLLAGAVLAEPDFSLDMQVGWGGCYIPSRWTPVQATVRARGLPQPIGGVVELSGPQDDLTDLTIAQPVGLNNGVPARLPMVTRLGLGAQELTLRLRGGDGKVLASQTLELMQYGVSTTGVVTPLRAKDVLIGVAGREQFSLVRLGEFSHSAEDGTVYVKTRLARDLPWDPAGYEALDVLVLADAAWGTIPPEPARAIAAWVRGGGVLLVAMGAEPIPADHPLADLLPCDLELPTRTQLSAASWGGPGKATLPAWRLRGRAGRRVLAERSYDSGRRLLMVGTAGFGRCGVLGFNPAAGSGEQAGPEQRAGFWREVLGQVLPPPSQGGKELLAGKSEDADDDDFYYGYYETGPAEKALNDVLGHLLDIPELEPMSIWWVVGLLSLLAVLLGPVDYFVLKRLDRQPLTWLTSLVLIGGFTVGAYFGVRALRAGRMQLRAVSLVDVLPDGTARASRYVGLFAPASDTYELTGLAEGQWWSAVAPVQDSYMSMNRPVASRSLICLQVDGSNLPAPVPINIWSMQCLLCEDPAPEVPFAVELLGVEGNTLRLRMANLAVTSMAGGRIELGQAVAELPPLGPGESVDASVRLTSSEPARQVHRQFKSLLPVIGNTAATQPRTTGLSARRSLGQAVVTVMYRNAPLSVGVAGREYQTDHIQILRRVIDVTPPRSHP